jgi:argininosuccinate synthase
MPEKIVLAYSGGLDTSIIIPWLKENYAYDVIAMVADVGQGDDVEAVVDKAYKTGAVKVVVEDLREEFLTQYVWPALKAGAVYENKYLLGTSPRMHWQGQRSGSLRNGLPGPCSGVESDRSLARVDVEVP